jgi:hypothetical protein
VWVLTQDLTESQAVEAQLAAAAVHLSTVFFFEYAHEAFWIWDYGPNRMQIGWLTSLEWDGLAR